MNKHFYKLIFPSILMLLISFQTLGQNNTRGAGNSLSFSNSAYSALASKYVNLGRKLNSQLDTSNITVEFWMNATSHVQYSTLVTNKDYNSGANAGFVIFQSGTSANTLGVNFNTTSGTRTDLTFTVSNEVGSWNHIAIVFDRKATTPTIYAYVNGVQRTSKTITNNPLNSITPLSSSINWNIAAAYDNVYGNTYGYSGEIDEVRIWRGARGITQIRTFMCKKLAGTEPGLAAYYTFNNTSTPAKNLSSGNNFSSYTATDMDGTVVGSPSTQISGAALGDVSFYTYPGVGVSNWSSASLTTGAMTNSSGTNRGSLALSTGLTASTYPNGVQIYYVKNYPINRLGAINNPYDTSANTNNDVYPSIFFSDGAGLSYTLTYDYSSFTTAIPSAGGAMYNRNNSTLTNWYDINATQDLVNKKFTKVSSNSRADFILGGLISSKTPFQKGAGQMVTFNGKNTQKISDYLNLGTGLNTLCATSNFTVEFWINTLNYDGGSADAPIIGNKDWSSGTNVGFVVAQYNSNTIRVNYNVTTGTRTDANFTFPNATPGWHHVAIVFDRTNSYSLTGASIIPYVDGVQATVTAFNTTKSPTLSIDASLPWVVAEDAKFAYQTAYNYKLNAQFDELKVWNVARTQTQIRNTMCQKLAGNEANLAAYYKFDEISGNSILNSSSGNSIASYTASTYNGNIINGSMRSISNAPLGDASGYIFATTPNSAGWSGINANTGTMTNSSSANRGKLTLSSMNIGSGGTYPNGAYTYYSKGNPYYRVSGGSGLDTSTNSNNDVYSGVFVSGGSNFNYTLNYDLSTFSSAYKWINSSGIYGKTDQSTALWNDLGALPDSPTKILTLTGVNLNKYEFIPGNSNSAGSALNIGAGKAILLGMGSTNKISDYVTLGTGLNSLLSTSDFTVEYWVNTLSYDSKKSSHFSNKDNSAISTNTGLSISQKDNTTCTANFKTATGTSFDLDFTFPNSIPGWHHIAAIYDRNSGSPALTIIVDGQQVATSSLSSSTPTASINSSLSWNLGEDGTGTYQAGTAGGKFNGQIDEFRVWQSVRSLSQIRSNMCQKLTGSESNLAAYFKFDEGAGVNATNSSVGTSISGYTASTYKGQLKNAPSWVVSGAAIGDVSSFNFPVSWTGATILSGAMVNVSSSNRGNFSIKNMVINTGGSLPNGGFIYYIKNYPNVRVNATNVDTTKNASNDLYIGTFISGGSNYKYDVDYNLTNYTSAVTDFSVGTLFGKIDASSPKWTDLSAIPNSSSNTISLTGITSQRKEYIPGDGGYNNPQVSKGAGNTLSFGSGNGSYNSDYATLGTALNSILATSDFTVEFWLYTKSYDGKDAAIFSNKNWLSGTNTGFVISQNNSNTISKINMMTSGGSRFDMNFTYPNSIPGWHHIAVVADRNSGKTMTVYVDGIQAATGSISGNSPTNSINSGLSWNLGEDGTGSYQLNWSGHSKFNGSLDEVRVWNTTRTATQIRQNMCQKLTGLETNLAAYYRLDNVSGLNFNNLSYGRGFTDYSKSVYNGKLQNTQLTSSPMGNWELSGAAFGDTSVTLFPGSWTGQTIVKDIRNSSNIKKGTITLSNFTTSGGTLPTGMTFYTVKGYPYTRISSIGTNFDTSSNINNDYYYGVFGSGGSNYSYSLEHDYSSNPNAITINKIGGLAGKVDQTITAWNDLVANVDTVTNKLTLNNFTVNKLEFCPGNTSNGSYPTKSYFDKATYSNSAYFNKTSAFNFGTSQNFSVEFWLKVPVNTSSFDTWNAFASDKNWLSGANKGWVIFMHKDRGNGNTNTLEFNIGDGSNRSDSYSGGDAVSKTVININDSIWHHVAMTVNRAGLAKLYLDGVLRSARTVSNVGDITNSYPVTIGKDALNVYSNHTFQMDEFKMWNSERTQDSIIAYMGKEIPSPKSLTDLLCYYKMDGSNLNLKDAKNNIPLYYNGIVTPTLKVPIQKWATYNGTTWSGTTLIPDSTTNVLITGSKSLSGKEYFRNLIVGTGGNLSGSSSDTIVITGNNFNISGGSTSLTNSNIKFLNSNNLPSIMAGNYSIGTIEFKNKKGNAPLQLISISKSLKLSSGVVDFTGFVPIISNGGNVEFAGGVFNNTVPNYSGVGTSYNLKYSFSNDSNYTLTNGVNFINDTNKIKNVTINHTALLKDTIKSSFNRLGKGKLTITAGVLAQNVDLFLKDTLTLSGNGMVNTITSPITDTVWLENGAFLNELNTNYIKGIVKSKINTVSFGTDVNMKGLVSLKWNGTNNPGNIIIERRIGSSLIGSPVVKHGNKTYAPSFMKWTIRPTNNGNLKTNITFPYHSNELNGVGESNLQVYRRPENTSNAYNWIEAYKNISNKTIQTDFVDSFSEWILGGTNTPLPVELLSFNAKKINGLNIVSLDWATANEQNNDRFEIERMFESNNWLKIGTVQGQGNSNDYNKYEFNDSFGYSTSSVLYYRLKQMDFNGQFTYSQVRKVVLSDVEVTSVKSFYNKSIEKTMITILGDKTSEQIEISLRDLSGKLVTSQDAILSKGLNQFELDMKNISKGNYIVSIQGKNIHETRKVLKY